MKASVTQSSGSKSHVHTNEVSGKIAKGKSIQTFTDNRPETAVQRKLKEMANNRGTVKSTVQLQSTFNKPAQRQAMEEEESLQGKFQAAQLQEIEEEEPLQGKFMTIQRQGPEEEEPLQGKFKTIQRQEIEEEEPLQGKFRPIQKKGNNTGLPDNLKSGIENLSGVGMDDVKVHYNSDKPANLQAHAFAQGTDIHVSPGQEKHLPHEAWHVVQQKQGRVKPTMQMKGNVNVNDDQGLEKEADVMGAKAFSNGQDISFNDGENKDRRLISHELTHSVQKKNNEIQRVLINPGNFVLNANLVGQYHTAETNGDDQSITSNSVAVHQQAIVYYKQAKQLRRRAGKLHQDQDGGHLTAIDTLDVKIETRKAKIRQLTPAETKPRATASSDQGIRRPDYSVVIGHSNQASWITGVSAWQPRPKGT